MTKLILRIEIAKSGPSHGWLGYRVDSEAPQTRRKSTQATRRACPNYDLPDIPVTKVVVPIEITKSGTSHGWLGYRVNSRSTLDPTEERSGDQESLPKQEVDTHDAAQAHPPYRNNQIGHFADGWIGYR